MSRPSTHVVDPSAPEPASGTAAEIGSALRSGRATTLAALEQHFRLFFADDADPRTLTRCSDGKVVLVNPAAVAASGYTESELLGGTVSELFKEDDATRAGYAETLQREGLLIDVDRYFTARDGSRKRVRFSATLLIVDGEPHALGTLRDISELEAVESARRQGERQLDLIADSLPVIISYLDADLVYRYVNAGFERLLSVSRGEVLGKRIDQVASPETWQQVEASIRAALGGRRRRVEVPLVMPGGAAIVQDLNLEPDFDASGAVAGIHMVSVDISERIANEASLRCSNRALAVLSQVHRALAISETADALLHNVCGVLVSEGGYRYAWVGRAVRDPERTIVPLATTGTFDDHLRQPLSWSDDAPGCGPAGAALRSGEAAVTRDIAGSGDAGPWRDDALRRGFGACAALPLKIGGEVFGVLTVCASAPTPFDGDEVALLGDVADNVAFGVDRFGIREKHAVAEGALQQANAALRGIHRAQSLFISQPHGSESFEELLRAMLELSGSSFGFIASAAGDEGVLNIQALGAAASGEGTAPGYRFATGAEFGADGLDMLFRQVVVGRETRIVNEPREEQRGVTLPLLGSGVEAFIGIPLWRGIDFIGVVGLANRPGGYDEAAEYRIQSLLVACGSLLEAHRGERERSDAERMLALENRALAILAEGGELPEQFRKLAHAIEANIPDGRCSIMLYDGEEDCLRHAVAPSMPMLYCQVIDGFEAREGNGICGTAAARRKRVIVADIQSDPLTADWIEMSATFGVAAGVSQPVLGTGGDLLGEFSIYFSNTRSPSLFETDALDRLASIIRLMIEQERARQRLTRSEQRFRRIFETASTGMAILAMDSEIIDTNQAFADMLGYAREELVGRPAREITVPGDPLVTAEQYEDLLSGKLDQVTDEKRYRRKDGSIAWGRRGFTIVQGLPDEQPLGVSHVEDITERKLAEQRDLHWGRIVEECLLEAYIVDTSADRLVSVNRIARENLGYSEEELEAMTPVQVFEPAADDAAAVDALLAGDRPQLTCMLRQRRKDGSIYPLEAQLQMSPVAGEHTLVIMGRDISGRLEREEMLKRFERIVNTSQDFMAFIDRDHRYQAVNKTYTMAFGMPMADMVGKHVRDVQGATVYEARLREAFDRALAGEEQRLFLQLELADGYHEIDGQITPFFRADGTISGAVIAGRDITDLRFTEQALMDSEERFRALYDDNPSMLVTLDADARILSINRFGAQHLGFDVGDLLGRNIYELIDDADSKAYRRFTRHCFEHRHLVHRIELTLATRHGDRLWVRKTGRVVDNPAGDPVLLTVCEDITETKRLSQQLEYQATHDSLTGLVNRAEFERRLKRLLDPDLTLAEHALCYLDLDQFKVINDTCGHLAGDELLRHVSELLASKVRRNDTLARLGGDEFAVLMERCALEQAERAGNEIRDVIQEFQFSWQDKRFRIGVSIGVVPINENSGTISDVLSAADEACYAAKDAGRNRVHIYHPEDRHLSERRGEMQWVARLNEALESDRFVLYQQPIQPLAEVEGYGRHFEILLRMCGDDGEHIPPGAFLPAAERYNLSPRLDRWVIEHVLEYLAARPDEHAALELVSINLSGHCLGDEALLDFLVGAFDGGSVPAQLICFEITETAAVANMGSAVRFIWTLKDLGVRFALDDFGSGLSSFYYLKNLPVDYVKIDGAFVKDIVTDPIDRAMVRSINEIGQVMGKQTIAEFVENDEIRAQLLEIGVDYAQGYGIGRPVPLIGEP